MKKRNRFVGYFVLVMLMVAFMACDSTSKQEGAGEFVDDSVITTNEVDPIVKTTKLEK